ncbi:MAG: OmpA family protein [Saprospiraceae bacterium]|nr:OmpA family protein [Saprospiraceae bacterium]
MQQLPRVITAIAVVLCMSGVTELHCQSAARMIREADAYYEHGMYRAALQYYRQGGNVQTWEKDTRLKVAICRYEVNDIDGAISLLQALVAEGRTEPTVFFYLGRAYQHRALFDRAARQFKEFVRRADNDDPRRLWVKDEILRCATAANLKYGPQLAYVENLGTAVNTFFDEFAPVPSPNIMDRLYFTSARAGNAGGMVSVSEDKDAQKFGTYRSDLYYSEHNNGVWRTAEAMDRTLNTGRHEQICGFSTDGQILYLIRGETEGTGELIADTFSVETVRSQRMSSLGDFHPGLGDRDLYLFNDTIMLFASLRAGGQGGYDLYYSLKRFGKWRSAVNLGPAINSHYDDVAPFLTRNGRELYFSSNRLTSMGGLDIFRARFDDAATRWQAPRNVGMPINSAGDDAYFRFAADGLSAYFSSDRKTGYGQRDLYAAYMKEAVQAHLTLSVPVTFAHVKPLDDNAGPAITGEPEEIKEFYINDMLFEANDLVMTPQNIKALDVLANLLLIYPDLRADLIGHDISSGPRSFNLYFSIKKAEQAAEHLIRKGVKPDQLYVKGCGALYPRATSPQTGLAHPAAERLNRRIEVRIHNSAGQPIRLIYEHRNIPENLRDGRGQRFSEMADRLVYRVHIATVSQMFQHGVFDDYDNAMIRLDPDSRRYHYYVGMETSYRDALKVLADMQSRGFDDARIEAHLEGRALTRADILDHAGEYPDLLDYLEQF